MTRNQGKPKTNTLPYAFNQLALMILLSPVDGLKWVLERIKKETILLFPKNT